MAENLQPGTVTTLGALRPGDVGVFVFPDGDTSEPFLLSHHRGAGSYIQYAHSSGPLPGSETTPVRFIAHNGRIEPARIVMEGEEGTPIEQTVRRVLAVAVADGLVTCACDPMTMTTGELVGPANVLAAAMGEQQRRIAELEAQVRTLREAVEKNKVHCHCEDPANCTLCERSAAALAATAPRPTAVTLDTSR